MVTTLMVLTLVLGAATLTSVVALLRARRRPATLPNAFRCKFALGTGDDVAYRWSRRRTYGVWVHDVLILFDGFSRTRVRPFAVHFAEGQVARMVRPVRGLDQGPVVMSMELDDGSHALVAAPRSSTTLVAGPFLAALASSDGVSASNDRSGGSG
ncbi:MAG: hypothetical protein ACJ74O_02985 [Frankiaceae bacterium]